MIEIPEKNVDSSKEYWVLEMTLLDNVVPCDITLNSEAVSIETSEIQNPKEKEHSGKSAQQQKLIKQNKNLINDGHDNKPKWTYEGLITEAPATLQVVQLSISQLMKEFTFFFAPKNYENSLRVLNRNTNLYYQCPLADDKFRGLICYFCTNCLYVKPPRPHEIDNLYASLVMCSELIRKESLRKQDERYVLTLDGIYDIIERKVIAHSPAFFFPCFGINVFATRKAEGNIFNHYIDKFSDSSVKRKQLFCEFIGALSANSEFNEKKIAVLYGHRITIQAILKFVEVYMCNENISHIPVANICDKNAIKEIEQKRVNISSHVDSETLIKSLSSIVSVYVDDYIYTGGKSSDCTIFNNKWLIFSTDNLLEIEALSDSINCIESILFIRIDKAIDKKKEANFMVECLLNESSYIFKIAMAARQNLLENDWEFTEIPEDKKDTGVLQPKVNSMQKFIEEECSVGTGKKAIVDEFNTAFSEFCNKNKLTEVTSDNRYKELEQIHNEFSNSKQPFNISGINSKINGAQYRVFSGIELNIDS